MISNEERRKIATLLREAASAKGKRSGSMEMMLSKLLGIAKQDRGVFGQKVYVAATWRDVYRKLADLIDRPTCKNLATKPADELLCSECGEHVDIAYMESADDYHANYCPNCGAEVVHDA